MTRKERWAKKGYTKEQTDVHLRWEREQGKQARERNKRNNEKNKELIKQIKEEIVGKTFEVRGSIKILRIAPTTDGKGFYYHMFRKFNDGSEGKFSYFERFDEYNYKEFIKELKYL